MLLFGLMHLPNWVFGGGPAAVGQVGLAFLSGTTFYLLRRGTGTLLLAMVLHGFWDCAALVDTGGAILAFVNIPVGIASVVLALVLTRLDRDEPTLAPYAVAARQPVAA
ncbi:type II CAAX prenyl endopeptidase Rce1 family protein [Nocardioides sp.]|uniref:CPBP family glutamic-type intramembrane protease n=1 Tax=Nocardioides sp. TaxID=35761 RepID=UPI003783CAA3